MALTTVHAGPYTVQGTSIGGIYTSLAVPELGMMFDCGTPHREFASYNHLFISHCHADHVGALWSFIGLRDLTGKNPLNVYLPSEALYEMQEAQHAFSRMFRYEPRVKFHPILPGDVVTVNRKQVHAFRTYHPVPSLGYVVKTTTNKLKPHLLGSSQEDLVGRKKAGEEITDSVTTPEFAYVTDTQARVLLNNPDVLQARVLVLECTFIDQWKNRELAAQASHIHMDDIADPTYKFQNEHGVLMHFSQKYEAEHIRTSVQHLNRLNRTRTKWQPFISVE